MSISYINIIRNDLGFRYLPPKKRIDLSTIQIENHLRFGYSLYTKNIDFKKILFSDESKFSFSQIIRMFGEREVLKTRNI